MTDKKLIELIMDDPYINEENELLPCNARIERAIKLTGKHVNLDWIERLKELELVVDKLDGEFRSLCKELDYTPAEIHDTLTKLEVELISMINDNSGKVRASVREEVSGSSTPQSRGSEK